MRKLLLIDDDVKLAEPLQQYLSMHDLELSSETRPLLALERLRKEFFDLVILDVMLPEIDGFESCRRIRQFSDIPIIMLTARGDVMDRVVGLELGADDYLPKPFEPRELVARIQSIFKRSRSSQQRFLIGELDIDLERKQVLLQDKRLDITATEYALLELLLLNQDRVLSRDEIMRSLRGIDSELYSRAIDVLVSRLRSKLQRPELIRTQRGQGYQFVIC